MRVISLSWFVVCVGSLGVSACGGDSDKASEPVQSAEAGPSEGTGGSSSVTITGDGCDGLEFAPPETGVQLFTEMTPPRANVV